MSIRLGVIGAGFIADVHLSKFQTIPDVCLKGITDLRTDRAQALQQKYRIEKVYPNADALLESKDIDVVIVASPNKYHAEQAVKALNTGKHVLCEKPMALNSQQAKEIVKAQRKSGKVLMVAHQMRWEPLSLMIKEQVDKGALGKIYNAKTGWWRRCGIPGWGSWFTRMEESGGGPLIDIGVHMLDLAIWLMGNPKPVSVFGSTYAEFGPKKKGLGNWGTPEWDGIFNVEDLATALIKMDNGATLSLEVSWAVHTDSDSKPFIHLMGTEGGASYYGNKGKFLGLQFDRPFEVEITPPQNADARISLTQHFIECIQKNKEPLIPAISGLANNLIIDAIYESAKTGKMVQLDWSGI